MSSREYRSKLGRLLWRSLYRVLTFLAAPLEIVAVLLGDYLVIRAFKYFMAVELAHAPKLAYFVETVQITIAFLVLLTVGVHLLHSAWVLATLHSKHTKGGRE